MLTGTVTQHEDDFYGSEKLEPLARLQLADRDTKWFEEQIREFNLRVGDDNRVLNRILSGEEIELARFLSERLNGII